MGYYGTLWTWHDFKSKDQVVFSPENDGLSVCKSINQVRRARGSFFSSVTGNKSLFSEVSSLESLHFCCNMRRYTTKDSDLYLTFAILGSNTIIPLIRTYLSVTARMLEIKMNIAIVYLQFIFSVTINWSNIFSHVKS